MHAMIYQRYGGPEVLRLETVARPEPGPDEALVHVHAAALNAADAYLLRGEPAMLRLSAGLRGPRRTILGADIAGRVVAVGARVSQLRPGDAVYGDLSGSGLGGFAEYVCAPAAALAPKPASLSFAQAAAVPMAAVTALQALRAGGAAAGQAALIHGASGGVGSFALQLAKAIGATVTAVCSPRHVAQARALGADEVVDYTQADFAGAGRRYDLLLVANGARPLGEYRRAVRPGGRLVVAGGAIPQILAATLLGPALSLAWGIDVRGITAQPSRSDLIFLGGLIDSGAVTPVIDRLFPLRELPEALRYQVAGHARGKVVISVVEDEGA